MKKNSTPVGSKHDYRRVCRTKNISTMIYPTRIFVEKGRKKTDALSHSTEAPKSLCVKFMSGNSILIICIQVWLTSIYLYSILTNHIHHSLTFRFSSRALKVISAILTLDNHMAISQCGHLLLFGSYAKLLFSFEGACNPYEKEEFGYLWTTLIAIFSMQVKLACDSR